MQKSIFLFLLIQSLLFAQSSQTGPVNLFSEMGENGLKGYIGKPGINFLSNSFQSGWYNSSKPYNSSFGPWGISLGTSSLSFTAIEDDLLSFDLQGEVPLAIMLKQQLPQGFLSMLPDSNPSVNLQDLPTFFGSKSQKRMTLADILASSNDASNQAFLDSISSYNQLIKDRNNGSTLGSDLLGLPLDEEDTIDIYESYHLPFFGLGIKEDQNFPSGLNLNWFDVGASDLPIIKNLNLGFRYVPQTNLADLKFSLLGFMARHEFLGWFIEDKERSFFSSIQYKYSQADFEIPEASVGMINHGIDLKASYDYKLYKYFSLGAFVSTGWEQNKLIIQIDAQDVYKTMEDGSQVLIGSTTPIDLSLLGDGFFKNKLGARISPFFMDLFYEFSFGNNFPNSHSVGITLIGLNGI